MTAKFIIEMLSCYWYAIREDESQYGQAIWGMPILRLINKSCQVYSFVSVLFLSDIKMMKEWFLWNHANHMHSNRIILYSYVLVSCSRKYCFYSLLLFIVHRFFLYIKKFCKQRMKIIRFDFDNPSLDFSKGKSSSTFFRFHFLWTPLHSQKQYLMRQ